MSASHARERAHFTSVSLTLRTATLFALVAALVVSGTGGYLYSAMRQEMTLRSDLQVTGRVEYFRHLLGQRFPLARLTANNGLFENMLGNEQDVLIFQIPGQKPLINVNPAGVALPPIAPTPARRRRWPPCAAGKRRRGCRCARRRRWCAWKTAACCRSPPRM